MAPGDGNRPPENAARPAGAQVAARSAATDAAADVHDPAPPPANKRSESSAAGLTFAANVGIAAISLVSVMIVARALGPSGRGAVALLTTIAIVTQYFATLGVQEANVNFGSADAATRSALATNSVVLALLFGVAAAGVLGAGATVFPGIAGDARPVLLWLALGSVPVQLVGTYLYRLVQADYRFGVSNLAWILAPVVNLLANATMYALGVLTVGLAVGSWVAGQTVQSLLLLWATHRMCGFSRPDVRLARRAVRFGIKIYPATVMNFANYRLDGWLLGVLANRRELGLYSIAVAWAEALFFLPTAVGYAQRPNLVRGSSDDANARAASGFRIAVLLTVPLAVGMVVAAPVLCVTVFGPRFHGSIIDLRILVLGAFGILALKLLGSALTARGLPLRQTAATAVAFACTVVLDAVLIPLFGGVGASIASTVAYTAGGIAIIAIFIRTMRARKRVLVPTRGDIRMVLDEARRAAGGAPAGAGAAD